MLCWGRNFITECWKIQVDCVEHGNWITVMVLSSRLLILGGPSSVPLWTQKYVLEERCLAVAVLLLQSFSLYVIVCFLCVFWIKNGFTYVLLTFHWSMVCLYVLILLICKLWWEWPTGSWNALSTLQVTLWKWQL